MWGKKAIMFGGQVTKMPRRPKTPDSQQVVLLASITGIGE